MGEAGDAADQRDNAQTPERPLTQIFERTVESASPAEADLHFVAQQRRHVIAERRADGRGRVGGRGRERRNDRLGESVMLAKRRLKPGKLNVPARERDPDLAERLRLGKHSDHRHPADAQRLGDCALRHFLDEIHPGRPLPQAFAALRRAHDFAGRNVLSHDFLLDRSALQAQHPQGGESNESAIRSSEAVEERGDEDD